jgi:hypothetical protein
MIEQIIQEEIIPDSKQVSHAILEFVKTKKMSYIDATIHVCKEIGIDIESANKYINPLIKNKLKEEALHLHFIKSDSSRLPL